MNSSSSQSNSFSNSTHKLLYLLAAGVAALISVASLTAFTENQELTEDNIEAYIEICNEELPMDLGDGVTQTKFILKVSGSVCLPETLFIIRDQKV